MKQFSYSDYDFFAYFYNKYWTIGYPLTMVKALERILFPYIKADAKILDLCCGTGNVSHELSKLGYDVMGVDGSASMLSYANINAPTVNFIQSDVRELNLGVKFDAIISLLDSMNHLLTVEDLEIAFRKVYEHLKDDAIFVFDINSYKSSITVADCSFSVVEDTNVFINNAYYDEKEEKLIYNITMFMKEDSNWIRGDAQIVERYYDENIIVDILRSVGYNNIAVMQGYKDLRIKKFCDRIFITARK